MNKVIKEVVSFLTVFILGLGLAGCGNNKQSVSKGSSDNTRSSKTSSVKKNSTKSNSNNKKQGSQSKVNKSNQSDDDNNSASSSNGSNGQSSSSSASKIMDDKSSSTSSNSSVQLGLGDEAVWTDSQGITHHVDSDGMDRQTTSGSQQVQYQDWSGDLPSNATVQHKN